MIEKHTIYFIDSNIYLYCAGDNAELKRACLYLLESIRMAKSFTATSIAVLEEVQFLAFRHHPVKEDVLALLKEIENNVDLFLPLTISDYHLAQELFKKDLSPLQSIKDYFHVACLLNANIRFIVSNDSDFDRFQQIERIDPIKFISPSSPLSI